MNRKITFKGNLLTLVGRNIKVGNAAPYFRVVAKDLKEVSPVDFSRPEINPAGGIPLPAGKGKIRLITSFPSIDTPVCDLQVKEFNKRAAG